MYEEVEQLEKLSRMVTDGDSEWVYCGNCRGSLPVPTQGLKHDHKDDAICPTCTTPGAIEIYDRESANNGSQEKYDEMWRKKKYRRRSNLDDVQ